MYVCMYVCMCQLHPGCVDQLITRSNVGHVPEGEVMPLQAVSGSWMLAEEKKRSCAAMDERS